MGNSYQALKQTALKDKQTKFQSQMVTVRQSCAKWNITPQKAFQIASHTASQIVTMLNSHQITSQALLAALALRCSTAGRQYNIFTATNFTWALQAAKKCDSTRKQTGKKNWTFQSGQYTQQKYLPPFYGIPISIKDVFHVQSMTTTLGAQSKAMNYEPQSVLIKCIKNAGMIPYIKTNIPQLGMTIQTTNNLFGRTLNPWNKQRAVGGSSGGQGAIISASCSILGLGSDIGGSIRVPAQHCGVYGLKTSSKRISAKYHAIFSKAFTAFGNAVPLCIGPLAKSSRDLAIFMNEVCRQQNYKGQDDPYTKIIPFNYKQYIKQQQCNKKLRIGYIKSMKDLQPSHASRRAIEQVIDILRKEGHQIIQIQIPQQRQIMRQFIGEYVSCNAKNYREILKGQKPIKEYNTLFTLAEMMSPLRWAIGLAVKKFYPRPYFYFFQKGPYKQVIDYQRHIGQIVQLKLKWIKYWRENKLNYVIAPGFGCQAFPHGKSEHLGLTGLYSCLWNVLDMVAGSMPVTVVREDEQVYESAVNDFVTTELRCVAQKSVGLPVGIQVIGLPYEEEKVLGFMSHLESKIKFSSKHPYPKV